MIPSTIATMSTGSRGQQQLATAAQQLPLLDRYGYQHDPSLSHPRVMAIRMEEAPDDIAFSSGQQDDIATSSPFTPLLQLWTYHRCDQPDAGPLHLTRTKNHLKKVCRTFWQEIICLTRPIRRG